MDVEYNPSLGERNLLYGNQNAVNPITKFASDGIVVWGQRTLQRTASALDRVNVRLLLNTMKTDLNRMLRPFVFKVNTPATRAQATNLIQPYLADIAAREGLTSYTVVCNETNNTSQRIDRNEFWVSIFIQPTRSVEYCVLNIAVLRTGALLTSEILSAGGVVVG
jgi:hypothetical protein